MAYPLPQELFFFPPLAITHMAIPICTCLLPRPYSLTTIILFRIGFIPHRSGVFRAFVRGHQRNQLQVDGGIGLHGPRTAFVRLRLLPGGTPRREDPGSYLHQVPILSVYTRLCVALLFLPFCFTIIVARSPQFQGRTHVYSFGEATDVTRTQTHRHHPGYAQVIAASPLRGCEDLRANTSTAV